MDPAPTPTFTTSAPAFIRSSVPRLLPLSLPAITTMSRNVADALSRVARQPSDQRAVSMATRSARSDHQLTWQS